ncbi:NTP transferase domain-containing protein [Methylopila henanensis]|uniref:Molybdenum cofactor guanylyltransferase n=1 Tax=Methylopila henanensis TaxID=873516 RepID=A0ABW4K551_9HYPH
MSAPSPPRIAGLVLMGGRGSRMGGADKALLDLGGRPILAHALERFRPQVGTLALSANGDLSRLAAFGLPALPDPPDGPGGPLSGVLAGLAFAEAHGALWLATIPGDAAHPPPDLVARLLAAAGEGPAAASTARGVEPLHALWPVAATARLRALVGEGVVSPKRALERLGAALVPYDDDQGFRDVDTPADLDAARRSLAGS